MGKLIKLVVSLVLLLVVIAIALPLVIDPNDYRDDIIAAVEENTGRKLTMEGELGLSVFPWVGIDIGKTSLGNAKGFGDKPFAAINSASVRIKLMPLFAKEIVADTITLDGLQLNLAKNSKGVTNWADLGGGKPDAQPAKTETGSGVGLKGLAIGGFSINNATINWQDDSTGQSYQVNNFSLNSGAIVPGENIDLSLAMDLASKQPEMTAHLTLDGSLGIDDAIENLSVLPLKLTVSAKGDTLPGGKLDASLNSDIRVNLKALAVKLENLSLTSGDLALTGNVDAKNLAAQPAINGNIKLAEMNLRKWLQTLGIALPAMSNDKAMSRFSADLKLSSKGTSHNIDTLKVLLDSTNINGKAGLTGNTIGFAVNVDQINVDDYLPPASTAKSTPASVDSPSGQSASSAQPVSGAASSATAEPALFPVELIRGLDINGKLAIGKIIVSKLTAEQLQLNVTAQKGVVNLDKKIGRFYEGSFDGNTRLNVAGKTPRLAVKANLLNLQAAPLIKDLANKDLLDGKGRFNMDITSSGNTVSAIKKALGGNFDFRFENGAVKGINLAQTLRETKAKFEGKTLPPSNEPLQTDFSELSGSGKITNGVINNPDLLAKSPFLRVNGSGTVNIVQETLDYLVQATVVSSDKGQGGEPLSDLKGLNIPVKLTGSYLAPNYSVDWGKVLLSSQKAEVDKKIEEKKQELKEDLQDKLKKKLGDGLFKGLSF